MIDFMADPVPSSPLAILAELADALRKRKSRSDASDEDLGLPRSPSTPPRNGGHHVVDGQINSTNVGRHQHHSSLGLLSMASSEIYDDSMESSSFLSTSKSSYEISSSSKHDTSDDIFPPEFSLNLSHDSDTKLSHSAAKHKMAIRPKKKGPSRLPRKPNDTSNALPPMPEVNEEFFRSSNVIDSLGNNKSQSLPRGMTNIITSKTAFEKHSNISTTLTKQTKSKFGKSMFTTSNTEIFSGKDKKDVTTESITTMVKSETKQTLEQTKRSEERTHSEEGFFRRFINRSGRKQKKERDTSVESDTNADVPHQVKKMETSTPAIKKSAELSIINVLSNVRANEMPIGPKITTSNAYGSAEELDNSPKSLVMRNDKLRSGPIARQRYTKDITQTVIDAEKKHSSDVVDSHKQSPHSMRQEFATSYLRFSPTKSVMSQSCDGDSNKFGRTSHYRSAEMLNTTSSTSVCDSNNAFDMDDLDAEHERHGVDDNMLSHYSVSLPKTVWPNEHNNNINNKFSPNVSRNGYGWGQCQQKIQEKKISKQMTSDHHNHHHHHQHQHQHITTTTNSSGTSSHQIKSQAKGKLVEKSKSFRLYTKNFNNDAAVQTRNECKSTLCPSLPDLNASNRSPLARPSRYSSNRENLQSLRFLNSSGNHLNVNSDSTAKWTPTRSSSSSRISEHHFGNTRFEINEMNLIPTSKLYSTLNTSDEMASYNIESIDHAVSNENGSTVLPVASKSIHYNQTQNINEIEDNIDKIMKSAVVTELYQIKTNSGNVSLTTITSNDDTEVDDRGNGGGGALNMATVENPPLLRHSTTATKLEVPSSSPPKKITSNVPEFMQIQLNRVDASRPKSCIEYSASATSIASNNNATTTSTSNDEDKERRFSNESIEISDKKKAVSSSTMNVFNSNLNKSTESLKSGFGRQSRSPVGSQQLSRGSSTSDINKTSIMSDNHSSDDCLDIDLDDDNDGNMLSERRKSVSDKKLKFEQQIEKIQAEVKRSSILATEKVAAMLSQPRKLSLDDESNSSAVVLRSKKSSKSSSSDDPTPELMKVFARRSLKIKDTDEYQVHDDIEREALNQKMNDTNASNDDTNNNFNRMATTVPTKNNNRTFNTDSDKENHVSSGAQSSIPKVEIYIKSTKESNEKLNDIGSPAKKMIDPTKANNLDMTSVKSIGKLFNGAAANRFSINSTANSVSSNNYRNSTAFFENLNSTSNSPVRGAPATKVCDAQAHQDNGVVLIIEKNQVNNNECISNNKFNTNSFNNNNFTKNTTPIISNKIGQIQSTIGGRSGTNGNANTNNTTNVSMTNANAVMNDDNNAFTMNSNKTTPTPSMNATDSGNATQDIEYKGIHERKAEWEKRASQAFK